MYKCAAMKDHEMFTVNFLNAIHNHTSHLNCIYASKKIFKGGIRILGRYSYVLKNNIYS